MNRVIEDGVHDGHINMSRDEALLSEVSRGGFSARVYGWDEPWVTLGRFQTPERALLAGAPIKSIIRPTGGKAVLHGHDVTLGLAASLESLGVQERKISAVYRAIIGPIISALQDCGLNCDLAENTRFVASAGKTADCFAHIAPNDVVDVNTGAKVCGCALRVVRDAVLVQASIPAGKPLVDPALVFSSPALGVGYWRGDRTQFAEALARHLSQIQIESART
ncbi:MAG: hypothetical protein KDA74_03000 [Planctomycetaceae bacterium]|nr:hypothetical protein [Planctomycetaceae bacterium]MCB0825746.1 hypothetical protein [Armatimonadota bacterium]